VDRIATARMQQELATAWRLLWKRKIP